MLSGTSLRGLFAGNRVNAARVSTSVCPQTKIGEHISSQEGNWARIEIDLHWISNGSTMDHDLRLQRTIHEVHPMQFDIRATNTVTTRPSRACITPGLQQDRSLALLYYFSHGYSSYPQRLRGGWTMAKPYQHRIGVRAEICFDLIFDICDPAPQQISQAVAEGSPTDRGRRRSFQGSKS
jgi:hypothetical protein